MSEHPYRFGLLGEAIKAGYKNQTEFARAVGVSRITMNSIINGWINPRPPLVKRIAKAIGMTVSQVEALL